MGKFRGGRFSKKAQPVPEKTRRALEAWIPPELIEKAKASDIFKVKPGPSYADDFMRMVQYIDSRAQDEFILLGINEARDMPPNTFTNAGMEHRRRAEQMNELERLYRRGQISSRQYFEIKQRILGAPIDEALEPIRDIRQFPESEFSDIINEKETPNPDNDIKAELVIRDPVSGIVHRAGCYIPGHIWQEAIEIDREAFLKMLIKRLGEEITRTGGRSNDGFKVPF